MKFTITKERVYDWIDMQITLDNEDLARLVEYGFITNAFTTENKLTIHLEYKTKQEKPA